MIKAGKVSGKGRAVGTTGGPNQRQYKGFDPRCHTHTSKIGFQV